MVKTYTKGECTLVGFYSAGLSRALSQYKQVSRDYDEQVGVLASGRKRLSGADITKAAKYEAELRSAGSVKNNMLDVMDMMDVADVGLSTISDSLTNIRGYYEDGTAIGATVADIDAAQSNINAEVGIIDEISRDTEYNGRAIIYGVNNITAQSGTQQNDRMTLYLRAKTGTSYRGIQVRVFENTGGNDRGTFMEGVTGSGYALDETSVGSTNVRSYDNRFYGTTANGLLRIDQMSTNINRMRTTVQGYRSQAEGIFDHMTNIENTYGDALSRVRDIDFTEELSKLSELSTRKEGLSALIASVNQTNSSSILALLPQTSSR